MNDQTEVQKALEYANFYCSPDDVSENSDRYYLGILAERVKYLTNQIDCATNALTDSIRCSGNDHKTNMHFVSKLKKVIKN